MTVSDKVKIIDQKIEQNKAQYVLARQTTKISALSSENVEKYEFLTGEDVLPEKDLFQKTATIKSIQSKIINNKISLKNYNRSDLIYNEKYNFYKYHDIRKFNDLYFQPKYAFLVSFYQDLKKPKNLEPQKGCAKK